MFVVFQCRHCDAILGDTSDWLKAVDDTGFIALGDVRAGSVYASGETVEVTSKFRIDNGAEYKSLHCLKCNAKVGLYYLKTGKFDKTLKNAYLFDTGDIKSYQVGVSQNAVHPQNNPVPVSSNP